MELVILLDQWGDNVEIDIDNITGVRNYNNSENKNEFSLYPNPAQNWVAINCYGSKPLNIRILNLSGKMVDNEWKNNSIVNLSNLEPGVYIVEVEFEHKKMSKKLIIH